MSFAQRSQVPQPSFFWRIPPDVMAGEIEDWADDVWDQIVAVYERFAQEAQDMAQANAPWGDISGDARAGLLAHVEENGTQIYLYLVHSVAYGIYLEMGTSRRGPLPIIGPTLEAIYGPLMQALQEIFR